MVRKLLELVNQGHGVCTDSRMAQPGDIFFALRGDQFNGNEFAFRAIEAGCQLAVIDDDAYCRDERYLLAGNALELLQELGSLHREQFQIPVLGITGSNGKTTTKELTQAVLCTALNTHATRGNLNNHIGVPLTILSWKQPLDMAIVEMGANHMGEIRRLCQIARPGYGLITNIGKAHLEGFGSVENIARAKSELYEHVRQAGGTLFVNQDASMLNALSQGVNKVTYGQSNDSHCQGSLIESTPFVQVRFQVNKAFGMAIRGTQGVVKSKLSGAYNLENILAAITIGLYFGVPVQNISDAIGGYAPLNHRSQIIQTAKNVILMDAYNANPSSMSAALEHFKSHDASTKVVLLGDMLELGEYAREEHRIVRKLTDDMGLTHRIFVGGEFSSVCHEGPDLKVFDHVEKACDWLRKHPLTGCHILIKGSRGIHMEALLEHL